MFKRILVANRGEIALRIIRCCREMGIETVQVYSKEDEGSLPVILATRAICIGPAKSSDSYLKGDLIIEVAKHTECDAVHPGYGFLSENAAFARECEKNGITFIGPSPDLIDKMGDKQTAREMMMANDVPVVPGSEGLVKSVEEALEVAETIGYPVLLKASAGGGGKGMRKVFAPEEMATAYESARSEAKAAFANDDMYLEKLIINPHHIEFQIVADKFGNIVHLGERDCSIQKNHQKLIEETPSKFLSEELRKKMGESAIKAARAAGYDSVGTVEFVVDSQGNYYFIEMNTRIQVEHTVTEVLTGIDLMKEQINIASGKKLSVEESFEDPQGHVIECRINAKTAGKVDVLHFPGGYGIRVDSHLYSGCKVSAYYDSMIAKIVAYSSTRLGAIKRMRRALEELFIEGVSTNRSQMYLITYIPEFIKGDYDTSFYEEHKEEINE